MPDCFLLFSPTGALHADRRTYQLEDVLILGHDRELQGVVTAETGKGQAEAAGQRLRLRRGVRLQGPGWGEGSLGACALLWTQEGQTLTCSGSDL